ncbi:MAG: cytochrome c biogenesis protein CcdA, partial [Chromatiales bacterium]|nr:cytochrome c biogenesis protein CcdA [Chromatiales bacterium]
MLTTIPLVVGFVGGYADGDRRKAFLYSLSFVVGLSLTFTALGAGGRAVRHPVRHAWAAGWYVAVGRAGAGHGRADDRVLRPSPFRSRPSTDPNRAGLIGAFLLGLFFGAVSSPCATPVLVVILSFVATQGQVLYGVGVAVRLRHRALPADPGGGHLHRLRRSLRQAPGDRGSLGLDAPCGRGAGGAGGWLSGVEPELDDGDGSNVTL